MIRKSPQTEPYQIHRFWSHVKTAPVTDCWIWMGRLQNKGYGLFSIGHRGLYLAHRIAYQIAWKDPVPTDKFVCHHCDNRRCCNPAHLFLGTNMDNVKDMMRKGRVSRNGLKGMKHPNAKLTDAQVSKIRSSTLSSSVLASEHRVSISAIQRARYGHRWGHLPNAKDK